MKKYLWLWIPALLLFAAPALATTISVESGGITDLTTNTGTLGSITDPWLIGENMTGPATIKFEVVPNGNPLGSNSTGTGHYYGKWIQKTVTNNTDAIWTSFELELQIALGVPSTDGDGLSFAQGGGLTFLSDKFGTYTSIEDTRDYLNFHGGSVGIGESVTFLFAITDNRINNPFWLLQTPNKIDAPVPEPSTVLLFGIGLAGLGYLRRRKRK